MLICIAIAERADLSMGLRLIIGNKNYSSWSFRPWLAMKVAGIAFEETLISLDASDFKSRVTALGGAGKVPTLIDGGTCVWELLAILEYLAEKFPAAALWPERIRRHGPMRARSRRRCMPDSGRCGGNCR